MTDPLSATIPLHTPASTNEWWRSAVIYQVYPRSFADADGDGIGDLTGITSKLPYLRRLGINALWISPFYPSPQADAGYDVSDYCDIDPVFGSLADADALISHAHQLGLRVFADLVPNHTSDEHPWFQRALAAEPGSPERDWYLFRDVDPGNPDQRPNNWQSDFGGPAWSKTPDGKQWYLHMFDSKQPNLNWENPKVRAAFLDILRFWLDRGIDGFRVDVAHALIKAPGLPDFHHTRDDFLTGAIPTYAAPFYDQDDVHLIYRSWLEVLDSYPGDRAMVAEAWVQPYDRLARYVRPDEFHQAFNFAFLQSPWEAGALRQGIIDSYRSNDAVGAPTTWVLSNHDVVRHLTRFALDRLRPSGLRPDDPAPDYTTGLRRARAASTMLLALPGSAYLYQGEELGLPEVIDLPAHARQDPTFRRTEGDRIGRDGCRVPIPWVKDAPAYGFNDTGESWLPQPALFGQLAADQQTGRDGSTLELYRALLAVRRSRALGEGQLTLVNLGEDIVAFDVTTAAGAIRVVLNLGETGWPIPDGARLLAASDPSVSDEVHTDTAVWLTI
ncbi:MAG: glycoside hydrolase family 13 protein [Propioniciclava sp.]|uniref:glycoside hydrolase family 13 protein n=1 Tax=Propioniciclava sp. TaxID=2038686 RepID=UPI0039E71442